MRPKYNPEKQKTITDVNNVNFKLPQLISDPNKINSPLPAESIEQPKPTGPRVFTDSRTGNPSGIEVNGKTYLGLSPEDVDTIAMKDAERNKYNPDYQPAVNLNYAVQQQQAQVQQQQAQQQAQARQQMLAQQLAQRAGIQLGGQDAQGNYIDSNGAPMDWKQVGLSTAADKSAWATIGGLGASGGVLGGSIGAALGAGAATGAAVGTAAAPFTLGTSVLAGIAVGALLGVGISVLSNIKQQKAENIAGYKSELTDGQKYLNQLTLLVQAHPENAQNYIDGFNLQMDKIAEARAKLYAEATSNLNAVIEEDATRELARFDNFYSPNGGRDILRMKMQNAILAPDAQKALTELAISQQSIGDENEL
jgi:hypothetical protein